MIVMTYWLHAGDVLADGQHTADTRDFHDGAGFSRRNTDPLDILRRHVDRHTESSVDGHRVTTAHQPHRRQHRRTVLLP